MVTTTIWDDLADLLRYPAAGQQAQLEACRVRLLGEDAETAEEVARLGRELAPLSLEEQEELFCRTFDLNPVCALEVGWQLFGEEYQRGMFLVRMRQEMARLGLEEGPELADHLTHVLQLVGRMEPEQAARFVPACVIPAVAQMHAALANKGPAPTADASGGEPAPDLLVSPYRHALGAIVRLLTARFGAAVEEACHG